MLYLDKLVSVGLYVNFGVLFFERLLSALDFLKCPRRILRRRVNFYRDRRKLLSGFFLGIFLDIFLGAFRERP